MRVIGQDKVTLSLDYLEQIKPRYTDNNYNVPKWIIFSEALLQRGWKVSVYYAKTTVSKYIYIEKGDIKKKVRFSNHKPNSRMESRQDADYYVGVSNNQVLRTEELLTKLYDIDASNE